MKCIKAIITTPFFKTGDIRRVSDDEAKRTVENHRAWQYCKKEEWKEKDRE